MKRLIRTYVLAGLLSIVTAVPSSGEDTRIWPHPIPCRIQDGPNPDLLVMTLGEVTTSLADGVFDPALDRVTLNNGTVRNHYYRDDLGVEFYQPLDKTRFPLPPSGMCTWYYYYSRINETEVRLNAEWMAENLKEFGAQYVQIDDGWQGTGAEGSARNWEATNPDRFPKGMQSLAQHITSLGLTPGIWLAPHGQNNDDVVAANPNVFLLKSDGTSASETWEGRFLLDPTTPESHTYLSNLFNKLTGWGYDYFKIDGQPIVVDEYRTKQEFMRHPSDEAEGLYRDTLETIRNSIGPDRFLLGCWGLPIEGAGIMNGSRTGGDIVLGWQGFQVSLRPTLQYLYLHNIVWYSDPDVLLVRSPLTLDQARVWATLQGLTGQALMLSDRLMDLSEERVELLRRVFPAVDIRPLDLFPTERYKRIWDLKINHLERPYDVVGVFNFGEKQSELTFLQWSELGIPDEQPVHVFDFWNAEYLGAWEQGMVVQTAPTSCRVLTLLPSNGRIQLISTSRHITQGWVDLTALSSNDAGDLFNGTSEFVGHDPYELRFVFPRNKNHRIKRVRARSTDGVLPVTIRNHQGWATVQFTSPETTTVDWEVEFEPADFYDFPPSEPTHLFVQRDGLDGVILNWREQYYLNAGYQVYLDGRLLGYTPMARFPIHGLDPHVEHTVQVTSVWENGAENERKNKLTFDLASLIPHQLSLTQLEPTHSTGRWRGFEIEELLSTETISLGGTYHERGLSGFANSEISFALNGLFDRFTALVGVDEHSSENGTVNFEILGDDRLLWSSNALSKTNSAESVDLDIAGIQSLVLRSGDPDKDERKPSQAAWAEPMVSRK